MKLPDPNALAQLRKAEVTDPVITGNTNTAGTASNLDIARNASKADSTGNPGKTSAKFTIRLSNVLMGRIRAAYLRDLTQGRFSGSLSAWAAVSLETAVTQSEATYNGGQPYQPIKTGSIPTGVLRAN